MYLQVKAKYKTRRIYTNNAGIKIQISQIVHVYKFNFTTCIKKIQISQLVKKLTHYMQQLKLLA